MSEARQTIIERIGSLKPVKRLKLIDTYRKMYNTLCAHCKQLQASNIQKGINPDFENLCANCQERMKTYEEKINRLLE